MAEEKKKRVRPTWAMVRSLEARLNAASTEIDDTLGVLKKVRCQLVDMKTENATLDKSNKLMEHELSMLRSKVALLEGISDDRAAEVYRLQHRGFWRRVFNR